MMTKYDLKDIVESIFRETGYEIYFMGDSNGVTIYSIDGLKCSCILSDYNELYLVINNNFVDIGLNGKTSDRKYFIDIVIKILNSIKLKQNVKIDNGR